MSTLKMHTAHRRELGVGLALAAAMWLTRSHHFATLTHLPDASWAAFFIAGLLAMRWLAPAALMVNAAAIDWLALLGGVSDYCVTPAYPFLVPTYLTLWASGRWAAFDAGNGALSVLRAAVALVLGVAGAFVISNASFYAFAGYFQNMPVFDYAYTVARYFVSFLESAAIYTAIALAVLIASQSRRAIRADFESKRSA